MSKRIKAIIVNDCTTCPFAISQYRDCYHATMLYCRKGSSGFDKWVSMKGEFYEDCPLYETTVNEDRPTTRLESHKAQNNA